MNSLLRVQVTAWAVLLLPSLSIADEWESPVSEWVAAKNLQAKLPSLAVDGMIEAKRLEGCWEYRFLTAVEKVWVDDVTVRVCMKGAHISTFKVEAAHVEGGLVKTRRTVQPDASAQWSGRIRQLLEE